MRHREEIAVSLADIFIPDKTVARILRKDHKQVQQMVTSYEFDRPMVRVVLAIRVGGGYNVQDGRHRVIAAKIAGVGFITAIVVSDTERDTYLIIVAIHLNRYFFFYELVS